MVYLERQEHKTLTGALNNADPGEVITIDKQYDPADEPSLPVVVDEEVVIAGAKSGAGTSNCTVHNGTGSTWLRLNAQNQFNPGPTIMNLSVVQNGGGTAIEVRESKFNTFYNVHVDGNGSQASSTPLWLFDDPDDTHVPNSNTLYWCSAEQGGGDGFQLGNKAHFTHFFGCSAIGNNRFGVWAAGPYSVSWFGGQLEDNTMPGFRATDADSVLVTGAYIERNAENGNFGSQEVVFVDTEMAALEGPCWCNGSSTGATEVVRFQGTDSGWVRGMDTNGNYNKIAYITDSSDIDLYRSTHWYGQGVGAANLTASAQRVRDNGVIIGAGSNHGGSSNLGGVNLGAVSGTQPMDAAISDGSNTTKGLAARWIGGASAWQPSDGGPRV